MNYALAQERTHYTRAAKNMLAQKGSSRWSAADQNYFDTLLNALDGVERRAASAEAHEKREGLDCYLRNGMPVNGDPRRTLVRNAMSTTTASEGGFTVASEVAREMVDRLRGYGWMRAVANEFTTKTGGPLQVATSDGTSEQGEIVAQNVAANSSDPSFSAVSIPTYRFSSKLITIPSELLKDSSVDIVAFLYNRMRDRIGRTQNAQFSIGDGTTGPQGLFTAATVGRTGSTGQTTTVTYDDLATLMETVDEAYLNVPDATGTSKAGWMFSQTMRRTIRLLKDTNGRPIWVPGDADGDDVGPATLLDYPVFINSDAPAPGAGAKSIAFGDFSGYWIRDTLDIQIHRFDDSVFAMRGQVGFIGFHRAGGNLADTAEIKLYQHSAS